MGKNLFTSNFKIPQALLTTICLFGLAEGITRFLWQHPDLIGEKLYCLTPAYDYGFDFTRILGNPVGDKIVFYPLQGYQSRKQSIPQTKDVNQCRIFVYGASQVLSLAKGEHVIYADVLKNSLTTARPEKRWDITTFAYIGNGSTRILNTFKKTIIYQPDYIIIQIHGSNEEEDEETAEYIKQLNNSIQGLFFRSQFLVIVKKVFEQHYLKKSPLNMDLLSVPSNAKKPRELPYLRDSRWLGTLQRNLQEMIALAKKRKIPVILIGRVDKNALGVEFENGDTVKINKILRQYTDQKTVFYLDTNGLFREQAARVKDKNKIFFDKTHYGEKGHILIAQGLFHLLMTLLSNSIQN